MPSGRYKQLLIFIVLFSHICHLVVTNSYYFLYSGHFRQMYMKFTFVKPTSVIPCYTSSYLKVSTKSMIIKLNNVDVRRTNKYLKQPCTNYKYNI